MSLRYSLDTQVKGPGREPDRHSEVLKMDIGNPKILGIFQAKNLNEIIAKGSLAQIDKSSKKIEAERPVKDQDPQNILSKISHMASVAQASPWTCKAKFNCSTTKTKQDKTHMCLSL